MDSQLGTRAIVLYVLGIIGFALAFIGVLDNFFLSGVAIVLAILSGVLLIAALFTSTALVIFRSLARAEDAADAAQQRVEPPATGSSPVPVRLQ